MPGSRNLTEGEIELARSIYGDAIDYSEVEIHDHRIIPWADFPHAPNGNIYYPGDTYSDDFSGEGPSAKETFIHEMGHVLQDQNGISVGWDVFKENVGGGHLRGDYEWEDKFNSGTQFHEWDKEEQAEFFSDLYSARQGGSTPSGISREEMETFFNTLDLEKSTHEAAAVFDPGVNTTTQYADSSGAVAVGSITNASFAGAGQLQLRDAVAQLSADYKELDAASNGSPSLALQAVSHPDCEKLFGSLADNGVDTLDADITPEMDAEARVSAILQAGAEAAKANGIEIPDDTAVGAGKVQDVAPNSHEDTHDYSLA